MLRPGEPVDYGPLSFQPQTWRSNSQSTLLLPWVGSNVVFLTTRGEYDPQVMARWLNVLDQGWELYADLTGQRPNLHKHLNGRATIAAVPGFEYTCGAGCGYVGSTGIELAMFYRWNYPALRRNSNAIPHYVFYEMGRNFYTFGSRHSCFTTGFAVFMRYVCMDTLRCQDDDRRTRQTIEAAEPMIRQSELPFLRMFTNVDGLAEKQPRLKDPVGNAVNPSDQPVTYASAMLRLWRENGGNEWLQRFYRTLRKCPGVSGNTREGALQQCWNWYVAASIGARRDLSLIFVDDWRLPLSPEARKTLRSLNWLDEELTPEKVTQAVKAASPKLFDDQAER